MPDFVRVAKVAELPDPGKMLVEVDDRLVVLFRVGGKYYALDDICTHDGGPLSEGALDAKGCTIACPRHGAKFDIRNGAALTMPATQPTDGSRGKSRRQRHFRKVIRFKLEECTHAALTEEAVRESLKQVIDPELFINIIDLGLVYTVVIEPAGEKENVKIEMTMTSPACPAGPQLIGQSKQFLSALPGVGEVEVKLVMTPPWSPDLMTEDARDQLGIF